MQKTGTDPIDISHEMSSLLGRMKVVHSFIGALASDSGIEHDDETFEGLMTVTGSLIDDMKRLRAAAEAVGAR